VPQYLGLEGLAVLRIGLVFQATGPAVQISQGKSFNGGILHGNKKEGKKEETLTARETKSRIRIFTGLSGEAPPERLYLFSRQLPCSSVRENVSSAF
jgi:hypothetical protein